MGTAYCGYGSLSGTPKRRLTQKTCILVLMPVYYYSEA